MLHGIRLRDGNAEWYRNRWVRTKLFAGEQRFDPETFEFDLTAGRANTHVLRHAGRIFALEEGSFPNEVSPDLDTLGPTDFDGAVTTPVTAHPHVCAETGEMHFFGYGLVSEPYVTYYVADATGQVIHAQPIDTPAPVMMHDFAISRNHAIFMDLPVVFDLDIALERCRDAVLLAARQRLAHRPGRPSQDRHRRAGRDPLVRHRQLLRLPHRQRLGRGRRQRRGPRRRPPPVDVGRQPRRFEPCYLWRWRFDLRTGAVTEEQLDDVEHAFPRIDDRRTGLANRYSWAVMGRPDEPAITDAATGVVKYDLSDGSSTFHDFGAGRSTSEPVFVPVDGGAAEDEGWVLSFVYDKADQTSRFVVLDAADMAADPVATDRTSAAGAPRLPRVVDRRRGLIDRNLDALARRRQPLANFVVSGSGE